jgi:hypothetical protein
MPFFFTDITVATVAEYVDALSALPTKPARWFRGQTNARWRLTPGLVRSGGTGWLQAEARLLTRFRQNALPLVPPGTKTDSNWDWLLLMQHYGVPTRLLDWTENALAGLYFATVSQNHHSGPRVPGCVWVLDPVGLNVESAIPNLGDDIPTLGVGSVLDEYDHGSVASAPHARPPVAVLAMRMFPRLVAQAGVFTLVHRVTTPLQRLKDGAFVGRILIPPDAKSHIADELTTLGVTRLSLFPELDSVAVLSRAYLT